MESFIISSDFNQQLKSRDNWEKWERQFKGIVVFYRLTDVVFKNNVSELIRGNNVLELSLLSFLIILGFELLIKIRTNNKRFHFRV